MEKVIALFSDALLLAAPIYEENKQLWAKWQKYYNEVQENHDKLVTSANISPSFQHLFLGWGRNKNKEYRYCTFTQI